MQKWSINEVIESSSAKLAPELKQKFHDIPYYVHLWTKPYGGLKGKKVLDFGCGSGTSAAGLALIYGAQVHGTDINSEFRQCSAFLRQSFEIEQPETLTFQEIKPGGEIEGHDYDLIFSWSVFEHVNNRLYPMILADLYYRLKPGGLFFVQISPLYHSPEGSHLWALGYYDWQHLISQINDVHDDLFNSNYETSYKEELWSMFNSLNRITGDDLVDRFRAAGFELVSEQRDDVDRDPPAELLRTYQRSALVNYQIVALFKKPVGA